MIRVTAAGLSGVRARIAATPDAARRATDQGLLVLAEDAAKGIRQALGGSASPSTPGTPLADPDGHIAAAVAVTPADKGAKVTVNLPYVQDLEFGTARMAARPFLRPAAAEAGRQGSAILAPRVRNAMTQDPR